MRYDEIDKNMRSFVNEEWARGIYEYDWDNMQKKERKKVIKNIRKEYEQTRPFLYNLFLIIGQTCLVIFILLSILLMLLPKNGETDYYCLMSMATFFSCGLFFAIVNILFFHKHFKRTNMFEVVENELS